MQRLTDYAYQKKLLLKLIVDVRSINERLQRIERVVYGKKLYRTGKKNEIPRGGGDSNNTKDS